MKFFENASLVSMKAFLTHSSFFYRPIALLSCLAFDRCGAKKASIEPKILFL